MFDRIEDTIVAISSPPGTGPRGIIRLSGPQAVELASKVFRGGDFGDLTQAGGHQRRIGSVRLDDDAWVPAEAYIFRAPASYTRQDLVELHVLGSSPVLAIVIEHLVAGGARPAEPGEFTGRAFLLGAMDLTRVEGVAAIIHAQSDAQLRASEVLLHGALGSRVRQMRERLVDLLSLIEAGIDFAEEPIEFVPHAEVVRTIENMAADIDDLLAHSELAERLEVLPRVVLAGLPNAGKSTLFNRLTGMDRAIQSALAGTTRDMIEAPLRLRGSEAMLCDTAGVSISSAPSISSIDEVELHARILASTMRAIGAADLVLLVMDVADDLPGVLARISHLVRGRRTGLIINKMDLAEGVETSLSNVPDSSFVWAAYISAATGEGVENLRDKMAQTLFTDTDMQGASLLSLSNRQHGSFIEALDALSRARKLCSGHEASHAELIAVEIRQAVHALGLLLGEVTTDDILARIFSRFCIGK